MKSEGAFASDNPIIVFDGICNLCNGTIKFILRNDHRGIFYFSTSQSEYSQSLFRINNLEELSIASVILIYQDKMFTRSGAILKILDLLDFNTILLRFLKFIPQGLLDGLYDLISSNRYRIFGKRNNCMVPEAGVSSRFIT